MKNNNNNNNNKNEGEPVSELLSGQGKQGCTGKSTDLRFQDLGEQHQTQIGRKNF
jgi:hypothetical protein